jgi:hypothetical protein
MGQASDLEELQYDRTRKEYVQHNQLPSAFYLPRSTAMGACKCFCESVYMCERLLCACVYLREGM